MYTEHLISADPGSCALLQTLYAHTRSHLRARKGFITKRKIAFKYTGAGYNCGGDGERGVRERAGTLYGLFALWRHEALLRRRGEHGPRVLIPSAMHRQAPSIAHSHPSCADSYRSPLKFLRCPSLCILPSPFCLSVRS